MGADEHRPGALRGCLGFLGFVVGTVTGVVLLGGRVPGPVTVVGGILLGIVVAVVAGFGTTFLGVFVSATGTLLAPFVAARVGIARKNEELRSVVDNLDKLSDEISELDKQTPT